MTRRLAQRSYRDPIKYTVGAGPDDAITQKQYDDLHDNIVEWFVEWRTSKGPASDVRHRLKCCLEGTTLTGEKWFSHWNSSLATRIRMMCRFDLIKMKPIRTAGKEYQHQAAVEKRKRAERKLKAGDPNIPEEVRNELRGKMAYGDNPNILLTHTEHARWNQLKADYLKQFPELNSIASKTELELLCDLQIQQERQRVMLMQPKPQLHQGALLDMSRSVVDLKKALGIHPDQLVKRISQDQAGSIAEAVRKLGSPDRARELRDQYFLGEMLTLWKMYHTPSPNPDSGGYQLDDVRLFAHTKCRTCACAGCGKRNFVGLAIDEIEEYLQKEGVLTPIIDEPEAGA